MTDNSKGSSSSSYSVSSFFSSVSNAVTNVSKEVGTIVSQSPIVSVFEKTKKESKEILPKMTNVNPNTTVKRVMYKTCAGDQEDHSFATCPSSIFNTRIGPNYTANGLKSPSSQGLYELIGFDCIVSDTKIDDIGSKVMLPDEWTNIDTHIEGVPPLFIVNIQTPAENPVVASLFSEISDGLGYSCIFYFRITQATADYLIDLPSAPPAVRLFADYCIHAPEQEIESDSIWKGRFKAIVRCENIELFSLPSFITGYNAKPVLIKQTGTLVRGNKYIEMDINGHKFNAISKGALHTLMPSFSEMIVSYGFCIESRDDDELPEVIFGCGTWNKLHLDKCTEWRL